MTEYDPSQAEIWIYNVNNDLLKILTIKVNNNPKSVFNFGLFLTSDRSYLK